jgi:hypothetical protein
MMKWEYLQQDENWPKVAGERVDLPGRWAALELGENGWELVSVVRTPSGTVSSLFKRPVEPVGGGRLAVGGGGDAPQRLTVGGGQLAVDGGDAAAQRLTVVDGGLPEFPEPNPESERKKGRKGAGKGVVSKGKGEG